MKKKLLTLFLAVCFCLLTVVPVLAVNDTTYVLNYDELISSLESGNLPTVQNNELAYVVDDGDLLTDSEESSLESKLSEIRARQKFDVVVLTTNTLNGKTPMAYADDYYDYNGYGYGENRDGALLLVSMEDRDWWISTCGYGITALTDYGIQQIGDWLVSYLSDGEYYEGFVKYADMCDSFVTLARNGSPYDSSGGSSGISNPPRIEKKAPFEVGKNLLISLVIAFIVALIITGVMKGKLKSVRFQAAANDYVNPGSLNVTKKQDLFLYSTVTKTAIPKESNSGGGGGSSTHVSSSGSTHGGGGGKF